MFKNNTVLNIFPTPVWVHQLDESVAGPMNERLEREINGLIGERTAIPPGTNWQTRNDLQDSGGLQELVPHIRAAMGGVLEFLKLKHRDFSITGLWANVSPPGGAHVQHTHPNNYLSGVYYVRAAPGAQTINFHEPRGQVSQIHPPVDEAGPYTSAQVTVDAQAGSLIVFPAWLTHGVEVNRSSEDRISIAFNIMFDDFDKKISRPLWNR